MTIGSHQRSVGLSQSHITPRSILNPLGPFDLDPCAADPRPWDCAKVNFTERDDGLSRLWKGRIWLNPPFLRYEVGRWIQKLAQHNHGIALLHGRTETAWFMPIWERASGILFLGEGSSFANPMAASSPPTAARLSCW